MKYLRRIMWSLALVATVIFSNAFVQTIQASEVLSYTQTASLTKDNQAVTGGTTVLTNEKLSATINVAFPDTQAIQEGDTLTLALPKELTFYTALEFDVVEEGQTNGQTVGKAVVNTANKTVTVTFNDYFASHPLNKRVALRFDVKVDPEVVTKTSPLTFKIGNTDFSLNYEKTDGQAGDYEMKYGYQDQTDPTIVKWRIILNARQDILRGMVIKDQFGDGLTLVEGSFRAVRFSPVEGGIRNEAHILSLPVLDNFSKKAVFDKNEAGQITGFTIDFGDNYNWPMYIEYSTKVAPGTKVGDLVHNTLTWTATNFPEPRSLTRELRLESGSGEGLGEKDQTPPTSSSTTTPESSTTPSSPSSSTTSKPSDPTTTESNDIPKTGKKKVLPRTGEKMTPVILLVGILGCMVGFTVLRSKKLTK